MTTGAPLPNHDELLDQLWDYLQGELSADQVAAFEAKVRNSPETIQAGVDLIEVMVMAREACRREGEARKELFLGSAQEHTLDEVISAVADPNAHAAKTTLAELAKLEAQAQTDTVTLVGQVDAPANKVSAREYADAVRYVFAHTLANKRLLYTAGSAVAAVLLIALSLVFVFSGGKDEPVVDPLANTPLWDTPTSRYLPIVATLTDSVGGQWRSDDKPVSMPIGAQLVAFERFTLTHGFAEITTRRGATALLQAPCTIELTDSDNAIRLHAGKLVGKCETPFSKGFIVHAPGMDVVDLGTEFGVEADASQGSTVFVMDGTVLAQPTDASRHAFTPVVLEENHARRIVPETGGIKPITVSEAPIFFTDTPDAYAAAVLDAGPLAYWRFDENHDGVIPNEFAPGAHDLRVVGPATLEADGVHGKAGHFSNDVSANGYFFLDGGLDAISASGSFTLSCWFWAEEVQQGTLVSMFTGEQNHYKHIALLELQPENDVSTGKDSGWRPRSIRAIHSDPPNRNGAEGTNLYSSAAYKLRTWQHVVLVKDGARVLIYLNGEQVSELPTAGGVYDDAKLAIGQTPLRLVNPDELAEGMRPLAGRIDEVSLYDRALNAEEIKEHWQAANATEDPS